MKFFILGLLVSFSVFATGLEAQLEKKNENYTVLRKHYSTLLANINIQNDQLFCTTVKNSVSVLTAIFEEDQKLVVELRRSENIDFREFAQHIEDNSYSPLFSHQAHLGLCERQDRQTILSLKQSLQYHVMNVDYLSMSNLLFWQTISTQASH
jgi:hypothetical protein